MCKRQSSCQHCGIVCFSNSKMWLYTVRGNVYKCGKLCHTIIPSVFCYVKKAANTSIELWNAANRGWNELLEIYVACEFLDGFPCVAAPLHPRMNEQKWWRCNGFNCFKGCSPLTPMFTNAISKSSSSYAGINHFFDDVRPTFHPHPAVSSQCFSVVPGIFGFRS